MRIILALVVLSLISCSTSKKKADIQYKGHGLESIDQATLDKYAPKSLPSSLTSKIEKMNELRTPSLGLISPNGKSLFVSWSVTGTRQIWKLNGPKSFPVQMTGGEDSSRLHDITEDGKSLIISRDSKGDEYPSLYIQSVHGGELKKIFGQKKVKVSYQGQSKRGRYIYYRANDLGPTQFGIYKYDLATNKRVKIFEGKGFWYIADKKENGEMILGHATGNTSNEYFLFNEKTKKKTALLGQNEREYFAVQFSYYKGAYVVLTDKFEDFSRLYHLKNGKFTPLTKKMNVEIDSFSIDKDKKRILISLNDKGYYKMMGLDARTFRPLRMPKFRKSLHSYFGSTSYNSRYTTFGLSFYNKPRSSYLYDWKRGKLSQWTVPSSPEISTKGFSNWQLEYYPSEDGVKIPMFVKRPNSCKNKTCPVVVSFHGGPEGQSHPSFSPFSELYANEGFIYVKPNVRGSSGYGKIWLDSDNGPKRLNVISDIRDCVRFIKKNWTHNGVIPKVGVTGGSYGGYATLIAMTLYAGEYDAGVARVGMSSLVTFLQNTAPYRRYLRESEYGYLNKDMESLEKLSPINYLDKIRDPLLIIQGATDPRVPAGEAIQFQKSLEKKGIDSQLILFADEGHGVRKRKNRTLSSGHSLNFFIKHLK